MQTLSVDSVTVSLSVCARPHYVVIPVVCWATLEPATWTQSLTSCYICNGNLKNWFENLSNIILILMNQHRNVIIQSISKTRF